MRAPARLLFVSIFLILLATSKATPCTWTPVPIGGGGYATGLAFHRKEKGLLYARTDVGGAYRWNEAPKTWTPLNDSVGREQADDMGVLSLALDPSDPDRLHLLCGLYVQTWAPRGALLSSADRGASWRRVELPFKVGGNEDGRGTGERLAVDPAQGSRLLAGSNQEGLWLSEDRGASWRRLRGFPCSGVTFVLFAGQLKADGKTTTRIYVGTTDKHEPLQRSDDGGSTWTAVPGAPQGMLLHRAALAEDTLYVSGCNEQGPGNISAGGIWALSLANGEWTDISPVSGQGGFEGLSVDAANPRRILAATTNRWYPQDEVFLSEDGGRSWRGILAEARLGTGTAPYVTGHKPHWISDVQFDPFNGRRALFVTGYGIYESRNLDAARPDWDFQSTGIEETVILELARPPDQDALFSVMGDLDGFRHENMDRSPEQGRFKPEWGSNNGICFAAARPRVMVRTIERGEQVHIAHSQDGGRSWKLFEGEPAGAHAGKAALSADGSVCLWTPQNGPCFRTTNWGGDWSPCTGLPPKLRACADAGNPEVFYVYDGLAGQVYVSTNKGQSFHKAAGGLPRLPDWQLADGNLQTVPGRPGELWITTGQGLYYSQDYGESLGQIPGVQGSYLVAFGKPAPGAHFPSIFLWGKIGGDTGLFRSDDRGQRWERINDETHQFGFLRCMTGDPRVYGRVYLGTNGRGIIRGDIRQE